VAEFTGVKTPIGGLLGLRRVSVDQQVQISADLANGQDREQTFAYLVQIQDGNGVTVSLAWITGSLSSGQSFSLSKINLLPLILNHLSSEKLVTLLESSK
jgi:hypothetical protein